MGAQLGSISSPLTHAIPLPFSRSGWYVLVRARYPPINKSETICPLSSLAHLVLRPQMPQAVPEITPPLHTCSRHWTQAVVCAMHEVLHYNLCSSYPLIAVLHRSKYLGVVRRCMTGCMGCQVLLERPVHNKFLGAYVVSVHWHTNVDTSSTGRLWALEAKWALGYTTKYHIVDTWDK